jgi:hypothetical protein
MRVICVQPGGRMTRPGVSHLTGKAESFDVRVPAW